MLVPLSTSGCVVTLSKFWEAIFLYYERPHIVNRKLNGFSLGYIYKINYNSSSNNLHDVINYISLTYETNKIEELTKSSLKNVVQNLLEPYDKKVEIIEVNYHELQNNPDGVYIVLRILIPSNANSKKCVEIITIDSSKNTARFLAGTVKDKYTLIAPPFPYTFECTNTGHVKLIINIKDADSSSAEWLCDKLFPKFIKWTEDYEETILTQKSLQLIDVERYCELYTQLKAKYGPRMIKIWPENTDPLKFVYEDVAIATYLITLWESLGATTKPQFVDLGCGNGLLTYILTEEGYSGHGIDIRRRKIWDLYPEYVKLQESVIQPNESFTFSEVDWIIGNHSDELTPWIPVIALRSSRKTNFFLLPCCSYDFNGSKYIRKTIKKSQYQDYLDYVQDIAKVCNFDIKIDKLRIPSTKRICIVGVNEIEDDVQYQKVNNTISNFIKEKCGDSKDGNVWVKDFQARERTEKVRNCTKIGRELIDRLVKQVVTRLLVEDNYKEKYDGTDWNAGGNVHFSQLVKAVDVNDLKSIKNECGGLQTLLKNHRYIFEISDSCVKLRIPLLYRNEAKYKQKPCWFYKNHPNGCINDSDSCGYNHHLY